MPAILLFAMHVNGNGAACAAIGIDQVLLSDVAVRLADRAKWQIHNDVCAESPLARSDTVVSESIPREKWIFPWLSEQESDPLHNITDGRSAPRPADVKSKTPVRALKCARKYSKRLRSDVLHFETVHATYVSWVSLSSFLSLIFLCVFLVGVSSFLVVELEVASSEIWGHLPEKPLGSVQIFMMSAESHNGNGAGDEGGGSKVCRSCLPPGPLRVQSLLLMPACYVIF